MKVAGYNLGCKVNKYELEAILCDFERNGDKIVGFEDYADVYIISTCAVTAIAEKKSRKYINRTKKINPNAITVALGCYIQKEINDNKNNNDKALLDNKLLKNIDIFIGTKEKSKIREYVIKKIQEKNRITSIHDVSKYIDYEDMNIDKTYDMVRGYVKIQDGCNNFCSYCIIPYVRGRERSRKLEDIIKEVNKLVSSGVKEVVLTGIEVASYGKDLENVTLLDVIKEVAKISQIERIRLSSLEQRIITDEFINLLNEEPKLCRHLHMSLQSGSDTVLKRMNRKYDTNTFYQKIKMLKDNVKDITITTDVIVGFPEETEEEFNETYEFIKKVSFADIHIFPYSIRTGTRAAVMKQVPDIIKRVRVKKLTRLKEELIKNHNDLYVGETLSVLVEEFINCDNLKYNVGHTSNFIKIKFQQDKDLTNTIVNVKIKEIKNMEVIGELVWEE